MKYLKRQNTNTRNFTGPGVIYDINGQVILDSTNVAKLPIGTESQRPQTFENGQVRYNTDSDEFEFYQNSAWRKVRFKEPRAIHLQNLGQGDGSETTFGPLDSNDPDFPVPVSAENILVFVENVYQIPGSNYTLVQNPAGKPEGFYIQFGTAVPLDKPVNVLHNFDK